MGSRKYNHIYQLLVQGDDDLIGQVAYALYKKEKHAWVERFWDEHDQEPTDDDVASFHCFICSEENIDRFRLQAKSIVQETINSVTAETLHRAQEELNRNHQAQLKAIIEPLIPGFWDGVKQGVVASLLFSILIVVFIFIIRLGSIDFGALFDWLR